MSHSHASVWSGLSNNQAMKQSSRQTHRETNKQSKATMTTSNGAPAIQGSSGGGGGPLNSLSNVKAALLSVPGTPTSTASPSPGASGAGASGRRSGNGTPVSGGSASANASSVEVHKIPNTTCVQRASEHRELLLFSPFSYSLLLNFAFL